MTPSGVKMMEQGPLNLMVILLFIMILLMKAAVNWVVPHSQTHSVTLQSCH